MRTNVCEDLLLVMFNQYYVRLYNLNWIKEKSQVLKLNERNIYHRKLNIVYGLDQIGLPIDFVLKEEPPILFKIKCYNHIMSIGSTPIHVLYKDVKNKKKLLIYNLEKKKMSGEFTLDEMIFQRDQIEFHPYIDSSLINFSRSELRLYNSIVTYCNKIIFCFFNLVFIILCKMNLMKLK